MAETSTVWRPNHKQEIFLSLPDTVFEALYGGAAFGGKSEALLYLPIVRRFHEHPKFKGLILRRTFPELEREIIRRAKEIYPLTGGVQKDEGRSWYWPASGAYIDFSHVELEKDVKKYDTSQYNYIAFDELTTFTEYQYLYLSQRCRSRSYDLPALLRSGSNPGGVGHGWVRKRFIEPCREGMKILQDKAGNKRIFIPAILTDNKEGLKSDPDYARRLELLPEADKRAKKYGDWWTFSGQVFDDWREEPFADEPPNARHLINPTDIKIPEFAPEIISIDWGYEAKLWCGFGAILPNKRVYIHKEYSVHRTKISTWATEIGRMADQIKDNLVCTVLCKSAWQNRGDDKTLAQQFQEFSGLTPIQPDSDRITGKLLLQEYLRWRQKPARKKIEDNFDPDLADKILRIRGLEAYHEYCDLFTDELPETNLPKLIVSPACTELRRAIPLCVYEDSVEGKPAEDVKEFPGDDPYDGIRYLVQAAQRFLDSSNSRQEELEQRNAIVQKLNAGQIDMTSFYRQLEYQEAQKARSLKRVRI